MLEAALPGIKYSRLHLFHSIKSKNAALKLSKGSYDTYITYVSYDTYNSPTKQYKNLIGGSKILLFHTILLIISSQPSQFFLMHLQMVGELHVVASPLGGGALDKITKQTSHQCFRTISSILCFKDLL